jgi:hypothetical protein
LYLENREREEEIAEEEPDLSDLPQHCTFAASGLHSVISRFFNYYF